MRPTAFHNYSQCLLTGLSEYVRAAAWQDSNLVLHLCQQQSEVTVKKIPRKFYNASEAAAYLGVSRQYFYTLKRKHKLEPSIKEYHMPMYAALDLAKIKALLRV